MLKYFCPDFRIKSLYDLSPKWLKRNGYNKIVVDVDNTMIPYDKTVVGPRMMTWIRHMHQQGINVALITNNGGDRMKAISRQTQLGCVMRAMKPLPTSYKKIVQGMGGGKILFIGDQLLTDVLGAKFAGHPVIWCQSLGGPEHWLTRFNRKIERFIANRLIASGRMPKERVL